MSNLEKCFHEMLTAVKESTIEFSPDNNQKLQLYAFYKQATEGDIKSKCPSILSMIERAKWMAWNAIKGMPKDDAMRGYLAVFGEQYVPKNDTTTDSAINLSSNSIKIPNNGIHKIAILGSGVMGSQIAAHFANASFEVILFDLKSDSIDPNRIADSALKKLVKLKPAPFSSNKSLKYITTANYDDNLALLQECNLVIEVVAERLDIKESLYNKIAPYINEHAVLATNTSGLSIETLSSYVPDKIKTQFCGIHFFNPPRYMPLVELIACTNTKPSLLNQLETFLTTKLGKSIIRAKDTPNFIANRLGVFSMLITCYYTEKYDVPLEVVDALTGKKLGRAKSATYRTADVVGLDVFRM